jgi:hypothetical protein
MQAGPKRRRRRRRTYTVFFIIVSALHVLGCHAFLLSTAGVDCLEPVQTSGRQQESMTIPKVARTVL